MSTIHFLAMRLSLLVYLILSTCLLSAQVLFTDISQAAGIVDAGNQNHGIAIADYDNDGDEDIYAFTRQNENKLFENQGDGTFKNVAPSMGIHYSNSTRAAVWGDLNNDGWLDLYLANYQQQDLLFVNQGPDERGQIQFEEISVKAGILNRNEPRAVHMADLDHDGWLDIYVANYRMPNRYFHNNGDLTFTDLGRELDLEGNDFSMSCLFWDYDRDQDLDLYLVHDFMSPNLLFQNDGQGQFVEVASDVGLDLSAHGMGVDAADVNRDGWLDLYITDLDENFLFLNQAGKSFVNIAQEAGVDDTGMGWSCVFADVDNDGWEDLYVINDSYFSPEPNILYRNLGNGQFEQIEKEGAISSKKGGIGGVRADINQDGYPELIISNHLQGEGNQLFLNQGRENNWLQIQLQGTESNHSAIGAMVAIRDNLGHSQIRQVMAGTGYASQSSMILSFGLEKATLVEQVKIFWPSGQVDVHEDLSINQQHLFTESSLPKAVDSLFSFLTIQPNPIEQHGQLFLQIPSEGELQITVLNQLGQPIQDVCRQFVQAGRFSYHWEEISLAAGLYFFQAKLDNQMSCYQSFVKR